MTAVQRNLLFSLPDVLMAKVFAFDTTYRIFGSDKFKKDLYDGWLKKQSSYVKERVAVLIRDYIDDDGHFMYKNEYCCIGGPSDQFFKDSVYGYNTRLHIEANDDFMVYVTPKFDVLYYKILPKEFINKPKEFFENLRLFDGFFCCTDPVSLNYEKIFRYLYSKYCAPIDYDDWYTTLDGRERAPFMYRTLDCWF